MYNLKKLKSDTNKVCRMAEAGKGLFSDAAVNWADFSCHDAQYVLHADGSESYRVLIEEANPDNREVIEFIAEELSIRGYKDIEVEFQW
ncbi:MAG: hypothetical protein H7831_14190 [Magnetococcus sp. WYHC-3]